MNDTEILKNNRPNKIMIHDEMNIVIPSGMSSHI
jgi:hypothetical protein